MAVITEAHIRSEYRKAKFTSFSITPGDKMTPAARDFLQDRQVDIVESNQTAGDSDACRHKFSGLVKETPEQKPEPEYICAATGGTYMNISEQQIRELVNKVVGNLAGSSSIPVEASARHVHLCQGDVDLLFGEGHQLTQKRELSQPGQYLCQERVTLIGPDGSFQHVAVLGPVRPESQVEISRTDARTLGVKPPVRQSGDTDGSPGLVIVGSKGLARIDHGVIVARNHIHMTTADAVRLGVEDKQLVSVKVNGNRPVTFHNVVVRVKDSFRLSMHIDFDEANAVELESNAHGELVLD